MNGATVYTKSSAAKNQDEANEERAILIAMEQNETYTIGVISDTHGNLSDAAYAALAGGAPGLNGHVCNRIIHAGDIGDQSVIDQLETIAPVTAVLGNCDSFDYATADGPVKDWELIEINGARLFVMHRPEDAYAALVGRPPVQLPIVSPLPMMCICGHTHVADIEPQNGYLLLNPGSASRPRGSAPTIALISIESRSRIKTTFVDLSTNETLRP